MNGPRTSQVLLTAAGALSLAVAIPGQLTSPDWFLHQGLSWMQGSVQAADQFGTATAFGDFDSDGYDDLAIGVPGEDIGSLDEAGAVNVAYGTQGGRAGPGWSQRWHQNVSGVEDTAEAGDRFGSSLAVGDFNNDGYDDLAIGVPYEDVGTIVDAGACNVLYGSPAGLSTSLNSIWYQGVTPGSDQPETGDRFGFCLAVGEFDGDGCDDLAVGVPLEDFPGAVDCGVVHIFRGSPNGMTGWLNHLFHQDQPGTPGINENGDWYGMRLEVGDFDDNGSDDLVIGAPGESYSAVSQAGVAFVYYSTLFYGVGPSNYTFLWQGNLPGGQAGPANGFGLALASGDFDADGVTDLAIGCAYDDVNGVSSTGSVYVLDGAPLIGIAAATAVRWTQDSPGVLDYPEPFDSFGAALCCGDFDGNGHDDLAITVGSENRAGAVQVLYGGVTGGGLSFLGNQFWSQNSAGVTDSEEDWEYFGYATAAGDRDGDGVDELAVGVFETYRGYSGTWHGGVHLFYGQ